MNSIIGTIVKAITAIAVGQTIVFAKPSIGLTPVSVDPYSEMEEGRVLEWWVLVADK